MWAGSSSAPLLAAPLLSHWHCADWQRLCSSDDAVQAGSISALLMTVQAGSISAPLLTVQADSTPASLLALCGLAASLLFCQLCRLASSLLLCWRCAGWRLHCSSSAVQAGGITAPLQLLCRLSKPRLSAPQAVGDPITAPCSQQTAPGCSPQLADDSWSLSSASRRPPGCSLQPAGDPWSLSTG